MDEPVIVGGQAKVPIGAKVFPRAGGPFEGEMSQQAMMEFGAARVFGAGAGTFEPVAFVVGETEVAEVSVERLVKAGPDAFAKYMRQNCKVRQAVSCLYMFMVELDGPALAVVACVVGKKMQGCLVLGRDKKDPTKLVVVGLDDVEGLDLPDVLACPKCGGTKKVKSALVGAGGRAMMLDCDACAES